MSNIMLDLETLDTKPTAVVVSIGAVVFDPYSDELGDRFYCILTDLHEQQLHGCTLSADTVQWWMQQSDEARMLFDPKSNTSVRVPTEAALDMFTNFVDANGGFKAAIWGNGSDFDNIILGGLYERMHAIKPWTYSKNRCFRTLKNLAPHIRIPCEGVYHHALDDAVYQAKHMQAIMRAISVEGAAPSGGDPQSPAGAAAS